MADVHCISLCHLFVQLMNNDSIYATTDDETIVYTDPDRDPEGQRQISLVSDTWYPGTCEVRLRLCVSCLLKFFRDKVHPTHSLAIIIISYKGPSLARMGTFSFQQV